MPETRRDEIMTRREKHGVVVVVEEDEEESNSNNLVEFPQNGDGEKFVIDDADTARVLANILLSKGRSNDYNHDSHNE